MSLFFLLLFFITMYICPQEWVPFMLHFPADYVLIPLAMTTGLMEANRDYKDSAMSLPQNKFLLVFLVSIALSNIFNGDFIGSYEQFILFAKKFFVYLIMLFVVFSPKRMANAMLFIVLLSVILVIQGYYQRINGVGWAGQPLYWGETRRITWVGYWDGANILALGFNIAFPFALEFAFSSCYGVLKRIFSGVAAILLISGIWMCDSRGGILTLLAGLVAFFFLRFRGKKAIAAAVVMVALVLAFAPARMGNLSSKEESAHEREGVWEKGYVMWRSSPIIGVGKGHFEDNTWTHLRAHSNYVQNFAEVGLFGFYFWLAAVYILIKGLYQVYRHYLGSEEHAEYSSLARALLASLAAFSAGTLFITSEAEPFYMLLGFSSALVTMAMVADKSMKVSFTRRDALYVFLIAIGIIMVIYLYAVKELFR